CRRGLVAAYRDRRIRTGGERTHHRRGRHRCRADGRQGSPQNLAMGAFERPTQAVIVAGGRGERLRPLTDTLPKPMVRLNERPFLEYLVDQLAEEGFERVLILEGYRADQIIE